MKFPVQRLFAFRSLTVCAALAASAVSITTFAQTTQPTEHATRASIRKANHRLEHDVRVALNHAKIETADVRIVDVYPGQAYASTVEISEVVFERRR